MKWTQGTMAGVCIVLLMVLIAYLLIRPSSLIAVPASSRSAGRTLVAKESKTLPGRSPAGDVQTLEDISIFDLRGWHRPDPGATGRNGQPAAYVNVLRMRKRRDVPFAVAHYATSGTVIDLSCLTLECTAQRATLGEHAATWTEYALTADIHALPRESEFMWLVEGTYWDGFRNDTLESAQTYLDADGDPHTKLRLVVLFSPNKRARVKALTRIDNNTDARYPLPIPSGMSGDSLRSEINWDVLNPAPGNHYELQWSW